jgi:hypothetical protein
VLDLLFFRPEGSQEPDASEIAERVGALRGVELGGAPGAAYRPGRWHDPATGASCHLDLGEPPLEEDTLHPPRGYAGWLPCGVALHLPLAGPHWFCVECLGLAEAILAAFPGWRALDTEDAVERDDVDPGPFAWSRPRVIADWERLRTAQLETMTTPRLARGASLMLWRYRRESAQGRERHPDHVWPTASAALERASGRARSVSVWADPSRGLALPPVELLLLPGAEPRVLDAERVAETCGAVPAGVAQARLVTPSLALAQLAGVAVTGFRALDDEDWAD